MNKSWFYLKYIFSKPTSQRINWNFFVPISGLVLGHIIIILTLAIMQGMENEVFEKIKTIKHKYKIESKTKINESELDLTEGYEGKIIISNNSNFRIANFTAIKDLEVFTNKKIKSYLKELKEPLTESSILIGSSMARKLSVSIGDTINLTSPLDINFITGIANSTRAVISGIFNMKLLDFDSKNVFVPIGIINDLSNIASFTYFSDSDAFFLNNHERPEFKISLWSDSYKDFISAMKIEKIAFTFFGILIILISSFTSLSMMSLSLMNRISDIGILRAIGFKKHQISIIFMLNSLIIGFMGSTIGIFLAILLIKLDYKFNLIQAIFNNAFLFKFDLIISDFQLFLIYMMSILAMFLSGLYPTLKSFKFDILEAINYKK